jgi:hypothetical protein
VLRTVVLTLVVAQLLLWGLAGVEVATPEGQAHAEFQCAKQMTRSAWFDVPTRDVPTSNEWWRRPRLGMLPLSPFC